LTGQTVIAAGRQELGGVHHLIIRQPDGAPFFLPEWMSTAEAGAVQIISDPRLPVNHLLELRILLDRFMASSSEHDSH
jgi:hypothetical protein